MYTDDYQAGERTFQLLTQAAGRAGRGEVPGEVVIQTYSPDHYSIEMAARQDYEGFYEQEMQYRSLMGYPPCSQLMAVLMTGEEEEHLEEGGGLSGRIYPPCGPGRQASGDRPCKPLCGKGQ